MSKKNKKLIFKKEILLNFLDQIKLKNCFKSKKMPSAFRFTVKGS